MSKTSILKLIGFFLALVALSLHGLAQTPAMPKAHKLFELEERRADDEMAYLDLLAEALGKDPSLRGHLVAYSHSKMTPGDLLMRIYGYRDYLVNKRGIDSTRLEIVPGGVKDRFYTEFWLVAPGADAPKPDSPFNLVPKLPLKFDVAYPDCPPEMTVHLYELNDSLKFYAEALKATPAARATIIAYASKGNRSKANRMARDSKRLLVKDHNIGVERISTQVRSRRDTCSEVELWLMSADSP